jgi:hypothetical protein
LFLADDALGACLLTLAVSRLAWPTLLCARAVVLLTLLCAWYRGRAACCSEVPAEPGRIRPMALRVLATALLARIA